MVNALQSATLIRNQMIEAFKNPQHRDLPLVAVERYLSTLFGIVISWRTGTAVMSRQINFDWTTHATATPLRVSVNAIDYEVRCRPAGILCGAECMQSDGVSWHISAFKHFPFALCSGRVWQVAMVLMAYGYALSNAAVDALHPFNAPDEPPHAEEVAKVMVLSC